MKREITAAKPTPIKAPKSPRGIENELGDILDFMISQMAQRYRNQVLNKIQVGTQEKFADAQAGNFTAIVLRLARIAKRSILRQFSNDRIETISRQVLAKLDRKSKEEFYKRVAAKSGINIQELIAKEGMKSTTNALMAETAQWVQTLRDEALQSFTNNTLFAMTQGESLDTIVSQFDDVVSERKNHARFLARNQVQNYNSITTKVRAQNLGITKAIWETADDDRVRPSHDDREGKEFDLAKGLYSSVDGKYLLPGTDYNCRCTYTMIIPETPEG